MFDLSAMYDLSGHVALVTGAGPNIGQAIAATLARAGATVLCNDLKPEIAEASAKAAGEGGFRAIPLAFDITDPDQVDHKVERASRQFGTISILVNNTAISVPKGLLTVSLEEWRLVTRVIQEGAFLCSRAVASRLVAANMPGAIVNIASSSGHRGRKNVIAFSTRHVQARRFFLDQPPDTIVQLAEVGPEFDVQRALTGQVDVDQRLDARRPRGKHRNPVGKEDRLVDLVRDKEGRLSGARENVQKLHLHELPGLRVECRERLVQQQ